VLTGEIHAIARFEKTCFNKTKQKQKKKQKQQESGVKGELGDEDPYFGGP